MPPKIVPCPHCGKPVEWSPGSRWRPFCSERCKMIDLGAWANESYRIARPERPDDEGADAPAPGDRRDRNA